MLHCCTTKKMCQLSTAHLVVQNVLCITFTVACRNKTSWKSLRLRDLLTLCYFWLSFLIFGYLSWPSALLSLTGPLGLTAPDWALLGLTWPYWALLCFTGSYWALLCFIGPYWALLGLTGPYWALICLTRPYWALLGLTGPKWALLCICLTD